MSVHPLPGEFSSCFPNSNPTSSATLLFILIHTNISLFRLLHRQWEKTVRHLRILVFIPHLICRLTWQRSAVLGGCLVCFKVGDVYVGRNPPGNNFAPGKVTHCVGICASARSRPELEDLLCAGARECRNTETKHSPSRPGSRKQTVVRPAQGQTLESPTSPRREGV